MTRFKEDNSMNSVIFVDTRRTFHDKWDQDSKYYEVIIPDAMNCDNYEALNYGDSHYIKENLSYSRSFAKKVYYMYYRKSSH